MAEIIVTQSESNDGKRGGVIQKINMYKDTAITAMKNVLDFDTTIIKSNDEYLTVLSQADMPEYDILKQNMEIAKTDEERQAIRDRMAEMKKENYEKDTENKAFYVKQQSHYKNFNLQVLGTMAVTAGLVAKYRKPLMSIGKKLLIKQ